MKNLIIAGLFFLLFVFAAVFALFGGDSAAEFTALTAVAAFGISLFNFYDRRFRSIHDLGCTLVAIGYNGKKFVAHYTFENLGTHDEIVLGGTFVFPEGDDGKSYSTLTRKEVRDFMPELMAPFILKPKEIVLKKFEWNISYDLLLTHFQAMKGKEFRQQQPIQLLSFKIGFVNPKTRNKSSKLIKSTDIKFYDDFVDCCKPYHQQNKLFTGKLHSY